MVGLTMGSPNRSTLRNRLRSALSHKVMADMLLDDLVELQTQLNAALTKLNADNDHVAVPEITQYTFSQLGTFYDNDGAADAIQMSAGDNAKHYFWFVVTDGANVQTDPVLLGTGHEVDILAADTAAQVAIKYALVVDALAAFIAPAPTGGVSTVTNAVAGAADDATGSGTPAVIVVTQQGISSSSTIDTDFVATLTIPAAQLMHPDVPSIGQNLATPRQVLSSALTHRTLASTILDDLVQLQTNYNALLVKLDAEGGTLASTNFRATLSVSTINPEATLSPAQDESTVRHTMRVALANSSLADMVIDSMVALQTSMNSALAELDAGNTTGINSLNVTTIDPNSTL